MSVNNPGRDLKDSYYLSVKVTLNWFKIFKRRHISNICRQPIATLNAQSPYDNKSTLLDQCQEISGFDLFWFSKFISVYFNIHKVDG